MYLTDGAGALPSRTVAVLTAIRRAVLAGELPPGHQLVETDLAARLGVSKTPVREALKTLAGAGLVVMRPYQGAVVRQFTLAQARQLYDVRLLLEPEALYRSVRAGRDDPAGARAALDRARAALARAATAPDLLERNLANRDFHAALYAGCPNPLLISMIEDLRDQTSLVSVASWRQAGAGDFEAGEHQAIWEAAAAGDAEAAAGSLRAHIATFVRNNFAENAESGQR